MPKFTIRFGVPEFKSFWNGLVEKHRAEKLSGEERKLFNRIGKAMQLLSADPKHNSLITHEIKELSDMFGARIWQSYVANKTPGAGRLFWTYGPGKNEITIVGYSPHPNDKKGAYKKIKLSQLPE